MMKKYLVTNGRSDNCNGFTDTFDELSVAQAFAKGISAKAWQQGLAVYVYELKGQALFDPKGEWEDK